MNTIELLETNHRKSPLDALAYADYLEEVGKIAEANRIRVTNDLGQKISKACAEFRSMTDCLASRAEVIDLLNGQTVEMVTQWRQISGSEIRAHFRLYSKDQAQVVGYVNDPFFYIVPIDKGAQFSVFFGLADLIVSLLWLLAKSPYLAHDPALLLYERL